jgi:putative tryptophan/tyrosine transport system substrate-binding protein
MLIVRAALAMAIAVALFAGPVEARQPGKVYTIGILSAAPGPSATYGPILFNALRDSGYQLGRNLMIEQRYAAGQVDKLPDLAADLVRRKVDLILAFGVAESLAAVKATTTIPIVFMSPAPVELGLVRSLARPGGNATGVAVDTGPPVIGKLLELLKAMVPGLSRVAGLVDTNRPDLAIWEQAGREAGQTLGVTHRMVLLHREADLDPAFAAMAADRPDALLLTGDPVVLLHLKRITDFARKQRLPTASYVRALVDEGGLLSYGPNIGDLVRRTASYADRILKGARPADLPVELPTKLELVINLTTAKSLGLTVPPSLLLRADEVVQ